MLWENEDAQNKLLEIHSFDRELHVIVREHIYIYIYTNYGYAILYLFFNIKEKQTPLYNESLSPTRL